MRPRLRELSSSSYLEPVPGCLCSLTGQSPRLLNAYVRVRLSPEALPFPVRALLSALVSHETSVNRAMFTVLAHGPVV